MIGVTTHGDLKKTTDFIQKMLRKDFISDLDRYGKMGVEALSNSTPVDSKLTANSWKYRVIKGTRPGIEWYNTNEVNGIPVAILIQYGHGTGTGGYVQGRDFINPAIRPIFNQISDDIWKKVRHG